MQDPLLTRIDPAGFAVLTRNRPHAMNAVSYGLMATWPTRSMRWPPIPAGGS